MPACASAEPAAAPAGSTVVLGVGNLIRADDGVGVHVAQALAATALPKGVTVLDGGTAPLDALSGVGHISKLVVVDAADMGEAPGTIRWLDLADVTASAGQSVSLHDLDLLWAMSALRATGQEPDEVVIIAVQPASLAWSTELSPEVAVRLDDIAQAVLSQATLTLPSPPGRG